MARSGSTDYISNRDQIINRALRYVGAAQDGVSPSSTVTDNAALALNALVKELHQEGYLWTREWVQHVPVASSLVLSGGTSYECIRDHTSGSTTEPGTGSDWKSYWRTRSGATGAWVTATSYNSIGQFNIDAGYVEIEEMFSRQSNTDVPIEIMDFAQYLQKVGYKIVEGRPSLAGINKAYDNQHQVHLYPYPTNTDYTIHLLLKRELQDFDASADEPDFPKRFENMLVFGLAFHLSGEFGIAISSRDWLERQFEKTKVNMKATDAVNQLKWIEGAY